jgi:uncharacterized Zn-finger protein
MEPIEETHNQLSALLPECQASTSSDLTSSTNQSSDSVKNELFSPDIPTTSSGLSSHAVEISFKKSKILRCLKCSLGTFCQTFLTKHILMNHKRKPTISKNVIQTTRAKIFKQGLNRQKKQTKAVMVESVLSGETSLEAEKPPKETSLVIKKANNFNQKPNGHENQTKVATTKKKTSSKRETSNSKVKRFHCKLCNYKTKKSSHLKDHIMTHTGERPFKCDECEFKCTTSGDLRKHKMTHTGEKPFKCDECDYRCTRSSNLKVHQLTHTSDRPFKCDQCKYKCTSSGDLRKHVMIHTGEKPFKCDQCEYKCILSTHLKRHKKKHSDKESKK